MVKKGVRFSYEQRKRLMGYVFISPWILGGIVFFIIPLIKLFIYSFSTLSFDVGKIDIKLSGFNNYIEIFTKDRDALRLLRESFTTIVLQTAYITILSLFIANILKQKFRGRLFARAIFFIPVIVTSGVVISIIRGEAAINLFNMGEKSSIMMRTFDLAAFLREINLPEKALEILTDFVNTVYDLTWKSGVQILILLAALQTVSNSLYEAAQIDGASAWETYWFITFPIITPSLLLTTIYSIVDELSSYSNKYQAKILQYATEYMNYSYSSALAVIYFICVMALIGLVFLLSRKFVFYMND